MGWFIDLFGLNQMGDRPLADGLDDHGTLGPAIDITFDLNSPRQRRAYNFFRAIGFDFWRRPSKGDAYAIADGITGHGDHGPVTFYGPEMPRETRPAPPAPVPPAVAAMPGYALGRNDAANSYIR